MGVLTDTSPQVLVVSSQGEAGRVVDILRSEGDGMSVTAVSDAADVFEALDRRAFDCVVTENDLGDSSGPELLERLRKDYPDVPGVLLAEIEDVDDVTQAMAAGASHCFPSAWIEGDGLAASCINRVIRSNGSRSGPPAGRDSSSEFDLLVDNIADSAIYFLTPDGYITSWNPGAARLNGYDRDEILGQHFSIFYPHDADSAGVPGANLAAAREEGSVEVEGWRVRKDGSQFWARATITALCEGDEVTGFAKITRDMTDHHEKERALHREREISEQFRVLVQNVKDYAIFRLDQDGNVVTWNDGAENMKGYSRDEILGRHFSAFYPRDSVENGVPDRNLAVAAENGRFEDEGWRVRADGTRFWAHVTISALIEDGDLTGFAKVTRDMTERRRREQELERQRNELAGLEQTNAVIRKIDQRLVAATTREEIETAVCTLLTEAGGYDAAWIGTVDSTMEAVVPRTWAGCTGDALDDVSVPLEDEGVVARTITQLESQVEQNISAEQDGEPWQPVALASGLRAAVAIPIVYGERTYGVLCVIARRPYSFDEPEVDVIGELGETTGHAINALEAKQLLLTERAIELEFGITDPQSPIAAASRELAAQISLEGITQAAGDTLLAYMTVTDSSPDDFRAFVDETPDFGSARLIRDSAAEYLVETVITGPSAIHTLTEIGGTVQTATAERGTLRVVAAVSPETRIRDILDALQNRFPQTELHAQREVDMTEAPYQGSPGSLSPDLTDRQRTVLNAAYHAGYLEQPRESTGGDLAAALGISASTFHQHLRAAERKLIEAFVDESR